MTSLAQLSDAHRRTYDDIFHRPIPTEVRRSAVRALLEALGRATEAPDNSLEVTRNGHVLTLHPAEPEEAEAPDVLTALRHFLQRSDHPAGASNGREAHLLLVIGRHETRLFRSEIYGGDPTQLLPAKEPAQHLSGDPSDAVKVPADAARSNPEAHFELVAQALHTTGNILVFGECSTTHREMDRFIEWLKRQYPDLAARIIGSLVLDEDAVDPNRLLEKAQEFHLHTRSTPRHSVPQASNPPSPLPPAPTPSDDAIRAYAQHLYEESGRAPGRDLENWLKATAHLHAHPTA